MKWIMHGMLLLLLSNITVSAHGILLTQEEQDYISKNPTIKVSNELDWYPYDFFEHNSANGYAVDLFKFLAKDVGLRVDFVTANWSTLYKKFEAKEIDILYPAKKTKKRESIALFSEKFIKMRLSLVTKSKREDIKSLEDMKGKTLGLVKNWSSSNYIKKTYADINYKEFDTSTEMLEAVAFGLVDGGVEDFFTANYIIKQEMFSNLHVVSKISLDNEDGYNLHLMFQKENQILQSIFNKALNHVSEEDILKLKSKWLGVLKKEKRSLKLSLNEKQYIKDKKVVKMCIDPNWMPLEMIQDGLHIGMTSDYMRLIEEAISIPIELVHTKTWIESIEFAKKRKCDIFSLAMATPERKQYMNFTKPYLKIPLVLVSTLNEIFYYDISLIKDKPIGIVRGYAYGEILKVKYPNMNLIEVENLSDGLDRVEKKELFGLIGTLATVAYEIQREYFGSLKIVGNFNQEWELGVGVRNDEHFLLSIMEKAIDSIDEYEHQKILNRWISVKYDRKVDYTHLYQFLVLVFILYIFMIYRQYQLKKYNQKLEILSVTDKLTGLYNRLKLDDVMRHEKNLFDRFHRPLSIIILDIDDFKKVNDKYGHKVGDEVLQDIAKITLKNKRKTDVIGRWGGEEFLVICHETDLDGAVKLAEKFRKVISSHKFLHISTLSASFGVAEFERTENIENVFIRADEGLYKAKKSGKNRVEFT